MTKRVVKRKILRGGLKNANFSAEGGLVITMKEGGAPECQTFAKREQRVQCTICEGAAPECQSFCQVPITLDFRPTHKPDPDPKPKVPPKDFNKMAIWNYFLRILTSAILPP